MSTHKKSQLGRTEQLSPSEILRYSRHLVLPEVGMKGQLALREAKIMIAGVGGLGAPAALYLAAAGVGRIGLVDFDKVDVSNLQRQVIYGMKDVGTDKVIAAKARLVDLNPEIDVSTNPTRLSSKNTLDIVGEYDVVLDCTDNFAARYLINDTCVFLGKPNVYGSIFRFEGQVAVFGFDNGPCYRCLYPEPPPPGLIPSCAEGGVIGVLPGVIGSLQANEAIKLIVDTGASLGGRLMLFDALGATFRELELSRNTTCPVCGDHPTIDSLVEYEDHCGPTTSPAQERSIPEMAATELKQKIDAGEQLFILDVREHSEHEFCNIGGHVIPLREIPSRTGEIDKTTSVVVYCRSGIRSASAVAFLQEEGFERVWNLHGGILAWADEVDPSLPKY